MIKNHSSRYILPIIVFAQFACTSVWFAGNAVIGDILKDGGGSSAIGNITSAVQFGFILGTLVFALFTISDRYSSSKVFFTCSILSAISNLMLFATNDAILIGCSRFLTGFFLAGIYPVGMKIASDHHDKGLGKALGFLVGALVLGTSFPHFVKTFTHELSWKYVISITSILSIIGGSLVLFFIPAGANKAIKVQQDFSAFYRNFRNEKFRSAAFGYFGHMWELYTFWAFLPILLGTYVSINPPQNFSIAFLSFIIIAAGFAGCVLGGFVAEKKGSGKTAFGALLCSFICCVLSPFFFHLPLYLFLSLTIFWGLTVVADSPQFSTLVAQAAMPQSKGTALTIVNCIGFSITILSIQVVNLLSSFIRPENLYLLLAIGPLLGLIAMRKLTRKNQQ